MHTLQNNKREVAITLLSLIQEHINTYTKTTVITRERLEDLYTSLYHQGNLQQKLTELQRRISDPEIKKEITHILHKFTDQDYNNLHNHDYYVDYLHDIIDVLTLNQKLNLMSYQEQEKALQKQQAKERSYYRVTFNKVQKQLSTFKIPLEHLYDNIRTILYLVEDQIATSYFDFNTDKYHVLHRKIAEDLHFSHCLVSTPLTDNPKYKITFQGNTNALQHIQGILSLLLETRNEEENNINTMIKEPTEYFQFPIKQLSSLDIAEKTKKKLENEFFNIITNLNNQIKTGELTQLPILENIKPR